MTSPGELMTAKIEKSQQHQTKCINPATGKSIGFSPIHSISDLKDSIEKARIAQQEWILLPIKERVLKIKRINDYLIDNADTLAEIISEDNGKTKIDALATEVFPAALAIKYYCKKASKFLRDKNLSYSTFVLSFKRSKIRRVPYGVIGIFSPWNYPFSIPFADVIMALLAGNAVILKVASEIQKVGLAIKDCIDYADLPENLFSYMNIPGRIAGNAFLEKGIDKLCFTGSVDVGKKLMVKASETLTPITLELGGNDPMLICEDADLERAAGGAAWAGFQNCGQSCGGVERIYVHEMVYDEFLKELTKRVETFRIGIGSDYNNDLGAMTTERQIDTIKKHINDALKKGGRIHAQSMVPEEVNLKNFIPATILTNVDHEMLVMNEESFGPVVGVMKISSMDEAVKLANDSDLGLTGSVWSKDKNNATELAKKIQAGAITINDHLMSHGLHETPWGGFKQSGTGRTHGEIGFSGMTQPQVIVNDILPFVKKDLWWFPFNKKVYEGLLGLMDFLFADSFGKKISGFFKTLKIVPRIFKS
jgi:acyl-CoA reductase-like NAD-dependent aldehyde dehydrogenase